MKLITRGSKLALTQTEIVRDKINKTLNIQAEIMAYHTKGDRYFGPFEKMDETGIFTSELNKRVLEGTADAAVHSLKDLPTLLEPDLEIVAVLERGPVEDVLVSNKKLEDLHNEVIGTSSVRRRNFLGFVKPELRFVNIRGNVDTRVKKYQNGEVDGVVLALAGIKRLNLTVPCFILDKHLIVPQANQGFMAVVARSESKITEMLKKIDVKESRMVFELERSVMKILRIGCHSPVGIYSWIEDQNMFLHVSEIGKDKEYRRDLWITEKIENRDKMIEKFEKSW